MRHPQARAPGDRARCEGRVNAALSTRLPARVPAAGDGRTPPTLKSRNESTAFASVMRHRCEQPLRVVLPAHRLGDRAGRSPGSRVSACRPAFPVSQWPKWTNARRLQLRGQPRFHLHRRRSVFPLASPVQPGEPTRVKISLICRERQASERSLARRCNAIIAVVAPRLQNDRRAALILDRLAGLARDTASRLPRPRPVTHTASYAIQRLSVQNPAPVRTPRSKAALRGAALLLVLECDRPAKHGRDACLFSLPVAGAAAGLLAAMGATATRRSIGRCPLGVVRSKSERVSTNTTISPHRLTLAKAQADTDPDC
jgi:hypothetical protein